MIKREDLYFSVTAKKLGQLYYPQIILGDSEIWMANEGEHHIDDAIYQAKLHLRDSLEHLFQPVTVV